MVNLTFADECKNLYDLNKNQKLLKKRASYLIK